MWCTRMRGLSEAYGSWKIICTPSRKSSRSSARLSPATRAPSIEHLAFGLADAGRPRCAPSVDLPQPDSPTRPEHLAPEHGEIDAVDRVHGAGGACAPCRSQRSARRASGCLREMLAHAAQFETRRAHAAAPGRQADGGSGSGGALADCLRIGSSGRCRQARAQRGAKAQPAGRLLRRGRHAVDLAQALAGLDGAGQRVEQAARVGVARRVEHLARPGPVSTIAPGVHHRDPVGEFGDHARGRA